MKAPALDAVKRFDHNTRCDCYGMEKADDGDYVDVADVRTAYASDLDAAVREARLGEVANERIRMHRLLDFAISEAEKISPDCIGGLKIAKTLVDP